MIELLLQSGYREIVRTYIYRKHSAAHNFSVRRRAVLIAERVLVCIGGVCEYIIYEVVVKLRRNAVVYFFIIGIHAVTLSEQRR